VESIVFLYIFAGAAVGLAVGITGVGGGSLMTPLLLLFGFPPNIAIGTDLLYAAITKSGGIISHQTQKNIDWPLVGKLALGSLPATILTSLTLSYFFSGAEDYTHILTTALGNFNKTPKNRMAFLNLLMRTLRLLPYLWV